MHILITGAAGMVGRKLTDRLIADGGLNGRRIDRFTLVDVVKPNAPAGFSGKVEAYALDVSREDAGRKLVGGRPDAIFHLAAVVSGEAETISRRATASIWSAFTTCSKRSAPRAAGIIRSSCSPR